jgi:hypothetical protein
MSGTTDVRGSGFRLMSPSPAATEDEHITGALAPDGRIGMSRYERTQYFETLYRLRTEYDAASVLDRRPAISIDDAIAYASAVMAAIEAAEAEEALELDASTMPQESTTLGDPRD